VRRALTLLAVAALVAVLVIGLTQAGGDNGEESGSGPTADEVQQALEGAPEPLAALYERGNAIEEGGQDAYDEQLRALRGYPVVVNAWASWCGPCKLEFPFFQRAAAGRGKEIAFLGLNVGDNRAAAQKFLTSEPVPYPSLEDGDFRILQEEASGARGLPVTIFYDAKGKRTFVHQGGYTSERDLLADIERYADA
jgi:thiol-disulfide isomerase/thioredoxin